MPSKMYFISLFIATFFSFVSADLHWSGLCIDTVAGYSVYNAAATESACAAYKNRNTGTGQWDTCPDCTISTVGGLTFCNSVDKHIGGDELNHYCTEAGAGGSKAD